jgi:dephospho-CoA kinase
MTEADRQNNRGGTLPLTRAVTVGITGGLGAGKSTALTMFHELGADTLSADAIVHGLYERAEVRAALHERFGDEVVDSGGMIDRRSLAGVVAADPKALAWLEDFIHPRVGQMVLQALERGSEHGVVVCEVPLLFESGTHDLFDITVTIEAGSEVRASRGGGRLPPSVRGALESRQLGTQGRSARADLVFVNDGSRDQLRAFVADVYEQARTRLQTSASDEPSGSGENR